MSLRPNRKGGNTPSGDPAPVPLDPAGSGTHTVMHSHNTMNRIIHRIVLGCSIAAIYLETFSAVALPPRVVRATPGDGERAADPGLAELRVEFDQPMDPGGLSVVGGGPKFPKFIGRGRWPDDRTFIWGWQLEPDHDYWLSINSDRFTNFRSRAGESAIAHPIAFRTAAQTTGRVAASAPGQNLSAAQHLRRAILEDYSYADRPGVDWAKRIGPFLMRLEAAKEPRAFAEIAAKMLEPAKDVHLWFDVGGQHVPTFRRDAAWNISTRQLPRLVPGWREHNPIVSTGQFEDGVRYACVRGWPADGAAQIEPLFGAMGDATAAGKPLIIDVRANGGGSEPLAATVAGCFTGKSVAYAKHATRAGGRFAEPVERTLEPNPARPPFRGRVAVLIGPGTVSSSESFAMMMKQAPHCLLIGAPTAGCSGNPKPVDLGNGVTAFVPSWRDLRLDGTCIEGEGFAPDIRVAVKPADFARSDPVIDAALRALRK